MRPEEHFAGAKAQFPICGIYGTTEVVPLHTSPEGHSSRAKAQVRYASFSARLKSCPDTYCGAELILQQAEETRLFNAQSVETRPLRIQAVGSRPLRAQASAREGRG
jgi:hypothetical protein